MDLVQQMQLAEIFPSVLWEATQDLGISATDDAEWPIPDHTMFDDETHPYRVNSSSGGKCYVPVGDYDREVVQNQCDR